MSKTVFHIENRGHEWLFHWVVYMLCGFRHINENTSRHMRGDAMSNWRGQGGLEQHKERYNKDEVTKPFNIYFPYLKEFNDFQKESLELIKDEFVVVDEISPDDVVINNYGEHINRDTKTVFTGGYDFIRELYLSKVKPNGKHLNKRYYISRNKSHLLNSNSGLVRRQVMNDTELSEELGNHGFETIYLEDFSFTEKIQIFQESEVIISPGSAGLTFTLFSNSDSKVVELHVENPRQLDVQYKAQCEHLGIEYHKYRVKNIDNNDNMVIELEPFINYLKENKIV